MIRDNRFNNLHTIKVHFACLYCHANTDIHTMYCNDNTVMLILIYLTMYSNDNTDINTATVLATIQEDYTVRI